MKIKTFLLLALLALYSVSMALAAEEKTEEITLTTYYPAPYGDYDMISLAPGAQPAVANSYEGLIYFDAADSELKVYAEDPDVPNTFKWTSIGGGGSGIWQLNGTNAYYNDGNVGIGSGSPDTKLEVSVVDSVSGLNSAGTMRLSSTAPQIDFVDSNNNDWAIHANSNKLYFIREPWNYKDLVLDGNGKVGIGTDSPISKLDVNGEIRCKGFADHFGMNWREAYAIYGNAVGWATAVNYTGGSGILLMVQANGGRYHQDNRLKITIDDIVWKNYVGRHTVNGWSCSDNSEDQNAGIITMVPFKRFNSSLKVEIYNADVLGESDVRVNYLIP